MIVFDKVNFTYEGEAAKGAVHDFSLIIPKGECVLICGPSGCGKTTVARMVNGLIPHYYEGEMEGAVRVAGEVVGDKELYDMAKKVGTVFQNPRSQFFCVDTTSELACGSVMTGNPEIIVLDEPSANLDYDAIGDLRKMLEIWKHEGKTILIAEHRLSYCLEYVDRVLVMEEGLLVLDVPAKVFAGYSDEKLHSLGLRSTENINAKKLVIEKKPCECFTIENLVFGYEKGNTVLDFPKISIPLGEIVAIVGANGVGKTTFLRCLCGMERKCKAKLIYKGKKYNNKDRLKLLYLVMQDVNHQLFTERHPVSLSGGQKQRVAVASAFAADRDIILFDEPTSGLDYKHMKQVGELLQKLQKSGKTILVVTHDGELIKQYCTYIFNLEKEKQ